MPSAFARAVDVARKRYKRQAAKYERIAAKSTGAVREGALERASQARSAIESLRYDRSKGQYNFEAQDLARKMFQTERGNVAGRDRLTFSGSNSSFYASTRSLWQGASSKDVDQAIVSRLQEMGYDVKNLDEAISTVEEITGKDFTSPQAEESNEFLRYDDEQVKEAMLSLAAAQGR